MCEHKRTGRLCACKSGAVYNISPVINNKLYQFLIINRIVLKISILNNHDISGNMLQCGSYCSAFTLILLVIKYLIFCFQLFQVFSGAVCRHIINKNNFFFQIAKRSILNFFKNYVYCIYFIINRNYYTYFFHPSHRYCVYLFINYKKYCIIK